MAFRIIDRQWHETFERLAEKARQRALLISPFLRKTTLEHLLGDNPREVKVITRFNLDELMRGVSDFKALEYLLDIGAQVKGIRHLHSKVYVFGSSTAIVTSANLTQAALFRNAEFGVESDNTEFVRAAVAYFETLWEIAGFPLKASVLAGWRHQIADAAVSGEITSGSNLDDYGADMEFEETGETSQSFLPAEFLPQQCFVKFFGNSDDRALRDVTVYEEIRRSGSHWALSYPKGKRPRRVKDGDLMFIGRLMKEPTDIMIYGRALGRKYCPQRDDATTSDINLRHWRRDWPHYIRVYRPEFINGRLGDCVSLYDLMRDLGSDTFVTTHANALRGQGNIDPRKAYLRQASVRLTVQAAQLLNTRFESILSALGRLTENELGNLD